MKRAEILIPRHYYSLPKWFTGAKNIKSSEKIVMMALIDYLGQGKDYCYPSIRRLSKDTGEDERTVQRALKSLEAAGHIRKESGNRNTSNRYFIHPRPNAVQTNRSYETCGNFVTPTENKVEGGNLSGGCGKSVTPGGGKMSTELPESLTTEKTTGGSSDKKPSLSPPPDFFSIWKELFRKRRRSDYPVGRDDGQPIEYKERTALKGLLKRYGPEHSQYVAHMLEAFFRRPTENMNRRGDCWTLDWLLGDLTRVESSVGQLRTNEEYANAEKRKEIERQQREAERRAREEARKSDGQNSIRFEGNPGEFDDDLSDTDTAPTRQPDQKWIDEQIEKHRGEQQWKPSWPGEKRVTKDEAIALIRAAKAEYPEQAERKAVPVAVPGEDVAEVKQQVASVGKRKRKTLSAQQPRVTVEEYLKQFGQGTKTMFEVEQAVARINKGRGYTSESA